MQTHDTRVWQGLGCNTCDSDIIHAKYIEGTEDKVITSKRVPYFPAYKTHRPISRAVIFSLEILEKKKEECILILVIYWKKTGLLHTKISNHKQ